MKLLKDILYKARIEEVVGSTNVAIENIVFDSREAVEFSVFVAVRGTQVDGHDFIDKAIENGSIAVVCEQLPSEPIENITYVRVKDSAEALAYMASNFYDHPSKKLKLVAVTGTNGKTSVVTLLHQLFTDLGKKSGLLSTVVNKIGTKEIEASLTTPDTVQINQLLQQMVDEGCEYAFMEASSHAIVQHRTTGLDFDVAVFTNISRDHLDYHGSFNNYIAAKKMLFDNLPQHAHALINNDDRHAEVMVQNTKAKVETFALKSLANFKAKILENQLTGLQLILDEKELFTKLVGRFNAYNLLAVYGTGMVLGVDQLELMTAISSLNPVDGRFQHIQSPNGVTGIVDYAHTPDALENVLSTIQGIRGGNESVIVVVGCGGDRDAGKRPEMAQIAAKYGDRVLLTSDNPRTEDPDAIIEDMKKGLDPVGLKKALTITSREEAIKTACALSQPGDIILIAGKGHETYQEVNGVRHHFDDLEVLNEQFNELK
ncbi:UDP-N-acetylmuramoyl-L-alanyl-D-glutamate--2,6-diaminopimelate ligase [Salibacter halophilus]|uniref:UDP-N-acetylmuramoyl-L-alanyl-D-glutamate--2,6-diaminopimelate ligase n=1 Tax=Salibacter halophilus TaxID=1803916 RepID=A0A6N6M4S1_9FLAO|nr:UDP-N-acetylmuramoyl-L-alanyl-D-glutamate--2,6-diaminopimelate ligase [Salibacter halophilus]KAB1062879.1 UDP-N-acetylmuramoyl-L-alanyl-D-glutamate--2,6-diaminopimelate ligase [Salibacter halophilus]